MLKYTKIEQKLKLAEEELKKQKKLFETMFNAIPEGIVVTNTSRQIMMANKGMETTFGYKPNELTGQSPALLYADQETFSQSAAAVFDRDDRKTEQVHRAHFRDKNRREFPGETFGAKLYDSDNNWIGNLGIMRDISERLQKEKQSKYFQEQFLQFQKVQAIGTLAGGISHDFNNILSAIIGFAELASDKVVKGSSLDGDIEEIFTAASRARDLIKQILVFAQYSDEEAKPIQVNLILKEMVDILRAFIPTTIEIWLRIKSSSSVMSTSTQLHQIVMNLCANAAYSMKGEKGILEISLQNVHYGKSDDSESPPLGPGDYVEIKVSHDEDCIALEKLEWMLEPDFITGKRGEGSGLGLCVLQGIVERSGGKIIAESRGSGGAIFAAYLPIVNDKKAEDATYESAIALLGNEAVPLGNERILFVDDEDAIAKMSKQMFESLGYQVTAETSGLDALELFYAKPNEFDLVISDMTMPKMAGDVLAAKILAIRPDVPIILCTGYSRRINDKSAREIGVKRLAHKPIVKSEFAKLIRSVLDEAKAGT